MDDASRGVTPTPNTGDHDNGTTPRDEPQTLRVGCPMWAHPPWVGTYLSPGNKGNELAEYSRWCNAVEGNTTFYATPSERTVGRWAAQAPADFRFAFKVPKTITHELRLQGAAHLLLTEFVRAIEPLGDRVGPIQIQLPPSFGPDALPALGTFVNGLPNLHRFVVEVRHVAFFGGGAAHRAIDELLHDAGVGRVVLDTRPLYAASPRSGAAVDERRTKPRLPVVTDLMGARPVVRVIGSDDADDTFDGLAAWLPHVTDWIAEGRTPFVFVHQPENLHSPTIARRFHAAVAEAVPRLAPLPEPLPVAPAGEITGQSSLF